MTAEYRRAVRAVNWPARPSNDAQLPAASASAKVVRHVVHESFLLREGESGQSVSAALARISLKRV